MSAAANQCCKLVFAGSFGGHMCANPAKYDHGGKQYCTVHYPPNVLARRNARQEKWEADWAKKREAADRNDAAASEQKRMADCYPILLEALQELVFLASRELSDPEDVIEVQRARAAIAKATGAAA